MRNKRFDFDFDNVDADGLAQAQARGAAGALTLNGALISGGAYASADGLAHQIGILSAADDHTITFTITGTDADGKAQVETVTGAAGAPGTTETTKYFKTVTSITASGAAAGNVSAGTVDEIATPTIPLDRISNNPATVFCDVTGTANFSVQECFDLIQDSPTAVQSAQWVVHASFSGSTGDVYGAVSLGASAIRLIVNSYTDTAEIQMYVAQPKRAGR